MNEKVPELRHSIREILAPELRKDGFRGSGMTYYRTANEFIQILNVQLSKWDGKFAINLGLHPLCIPMDDGTPPEMKKMKEYECVLRRRLNEDNFDSWFEYGEKQSTMHNAVEKALGMYESIGRELFREVALPTSQLNVITAKSFEQSEFNFQGFGNTELTMAWTLARMRKHSGNNQEALYFANIAIKKIGTKMAGRGILPELKKFVSEIN